MIFISSCSTASTGGLQCLQRLMVHLQHTSPTAGRFSSLAQQQQQECSSARGLSLSDLPPHIILIRHGETAGLESLQEDLQVPNHRIPLSARGVQESLQAGKTVQQLLSNPPPVGSNAQQQQQQQHCGRLFLHTSPFLRCIQTAQHITRALDEEQLVGFQEEVQLREQDWGNFQVPGQQAYNYEQRLKYGRFFYRFPDGESAADVYDRMTMFQGNFVRDIACRRFAGNTSVALVTHGLALRLFLMRWLRWSVDDFLQVHNPPTAELIVLSRRELDPCSNNRDSSSSGSSSGSSDGNSGSSGSSDGNSSGSSGSSDGNSSGSSGLPLGLESIKSCYALTADSLQRLKGVSAQMGAGRRGSTKQQLLQWRPYLKQVPPPPAMDPAQEELLHQLMEVGYGNIRQ